MRIRWFRWIMRFRVANVPWVAWLLVRLHADGWCRIVALTDAKAWLIFGQGMEQLAMVSGARRRLVADTVKDPCVGQVIPVVGVREVVRQYEEWQWTMKRRVAHDR